MNAVIFTQAERQQWMSVLAHAPSERIQHYWQVLRLTPDYQVLRAAETGLIQLKARTGGTGAPFFAGDATMTRCVIRLQQGTTGYGYRLGREGEATLLCALADALLQERDYHTQLQTQLITPLLLEQQQRRKQRDQAVEATQVDFFTLVRGEDA